MANRLQSGFTLVELLSVLTISGLLFSFSIASYRTIAETQKTDTAVADFILVLQKARTLAFIKEDQPWCTNVSYYRVQGCGQSCAGGISYYQIFATCATNETRLVTARSNVPAGINYTFSGASTIDIRFPTHASQIINSGTASFRNVATGETSEVTVNEFGVIIAD